MAAPIDIHIVDHMSRLTPPVDSSGSMSDHRPMEMNIPDMDFASLYPSSMSIRSIVTSLPIKTSEDLITKWEEEQENTLRWSEGVAAYNKRVIELQLTMQRSARTIGMDLVAVQPMQAPQGMVHYLDYVYREPECPIGDFINRIENETDEG